MGLLTWLGKGGSSQDGMVEKGRDSGVSLLNPLPAADTSHALLQILLALPVFGTIGPFILLQLLLQWPAVCGFPSWLHSALHLAHIMYLSPHGLAPLPWYWDIKLYWTHSDAYVSSLDIEVQGSQDTVLEPLSNRSQEPVDKLFPNLLFNQTLLRPSILVASQKPPVGSQSHRHYVGVSSATLLIASASFPDSLSFPLALASLVLHSLRR